MILFSVLEVCLCPVMTYVLSGQGMYVCIRYSHPELCVVAFASTMASKTWSLELGMAKACTILEISCCREAMAVRMAGKLSSTTRSRCWSVRIACLAATPWPPFCAVGAPMIETSSGMLSSLRARYHGDL